MNFLFHFKIGILIGCLYVAYKLQLIANKRTFIPVIRPIQNNKRTFLQVVYN